MGSLLILLSLSCNAIDERRNAFLKFNSMIEFNKTDILNHCFDHIDKHVDYYEEFRVGLYKIYKRNIIEATISLSYPYGMPFRGDHSVIFLQ